MAYRAIHESIQPKRFLSYSRRDRAFIERHVKRNGLLTMATWLDVEQIAAGELWREQIERAIHDCDEFILLVTDHSLASAEVTRELEIAQEHNKALVLILVRPLSSRDRVPCSAIHRVDFIDKSAAQIDIELKQLFSADEQPRCSTGPIAAQIKSRAARGLWPRFASSANEVERRQTADILKTAALSAPDTSAIVLNDGLIACESRNTDHGLRQIKRYAEATNSLAGWYFLALFLPKQRSLRSLTMRDAKYGYEAIERAAALAENPLVSLLRALYEACAHNGSLRTVMRALQDLAELQGQLREDPAEHRRFYFATRATWSDLPELNEPVRVLFRGLANDG